MKNLNKKNKSTNKQTNKQTKNDSGKKYRNENGSSQWSSVCKFKQYYYLDGIRSLPNGHLLLLELRKQKKAFPKTRKLIKEEKINFLKEELNALRKYEKINAFRTILL